MISHKNGVSIPLCNVRGIIAIWWLPYSILAHNIILRLGREKKKTERKMSKLIGNDISKRNHGIHLGLTSFFLSSKYSRKRSRLSYEQCLWQLADRFCFMVQLEMLSHKYWQSEMKLKEIFKKTCNHQKMAPPGRFLCYVTNAIMAGWGLLGECPHLGRS